MLLSTPNNLNLKNKEIKFEVISDKNNKFNFHFSNNNNNFLTISSFYDNNLHKIEYESKFDFSYIKNVKLFTIYDTLDECLDEIFSGINTGKCLLTEKEHLIYLEIPLNNIKYKNIFFEIKEKLKNDKDKIQELYKIVENQKNEIIDLKNEISNLKNIIKDLLIFKDKIEKEKEKEKEEKLNMIEINSDIIKDNKNYKKILKKWIEPNKIIRTKLLYKLTKDGESMKIFHDLCDNISPTLFITESINNKIFGTFTTCSLKNSNEPLELKDDKTFIFDLNSNNIFKKKNKNSRDLEIEPNYLRFGGANLKKI